MRGCTYCISGRRLISHNSACSPECVRVVLYGEARHRRRRMAAPTSAAETAQAEATALQEQARRHLWMHFTRMGAYGPDHEVPIIVRGEGCYVWDDHGNRYLDGLSALFCVNSGHGRTELGEAMAARWASSISSRCGAMPIRARSSWRRGSPV